MKLTLRRIALAPLVVLAFVGVASAQGTPIAVVPAPVAQPTAVPAPTPSLNVASIANLGEMEKRLTTLDRDLGDGKKELEGIGPKRQLLASRTRTRGRLLYKMLRAGLMPLSGGFSSFVDHAQRVERLKRALKSDLGEETRLATRAVALAQSLDAWSKERAELSEKKGILEAAKIALDEERRRHEAFERAFGASTYTPKTSLGSADIVVYGPTGKTVPESINPGSFKARKGRLTFPVSGQAEVKPTTRDGGPAVEIKATLGAIVRAVHAGRVAFADRYGTYGSLVILDHGDRYYTVSAGLGSVDVKVGDEVSAGEKIGTVGNPGGDGHGAALYFEIREGNNKVAPTAWLGL